MIQAKEPIARPTGFEDRLAKLLDDARHLAKSRPELVPTSTRRGSSWEAQKWKK